MTKAEKLTMLQEICGDSDATSAMLSIYLDLAADIVVHRAYPFLTSYILAEVPDRYATLQVQIANELYLHRGAEGEKDHTENGVKRTYETGTVSDSLLKKIVPFTRVIGQELPESIVLYASISFTTLAVGESGEIKNYTEVTCNNGAVKDVNEGYTYESSDNAIAKVADGMITAISTGDVTITVTGKKSNMTASLNLTVV